jgi:anti-sigma regulatory factor (Ser/Thr protein kinase)
MLRTVHDHGGQRHDGQGGGEEDERRRRAEGVQHGATGMAISSQWMDGLRVTRPPHLGAAQER